MELIRNNNHETFDQLFDDIVPAKYHTACISLHRFDLVQETHCILGWEITPKNAYLAGRNGLDVDWFITKTIHPSHAILGRWVKHKDLTPAGIRYLSGPCTDFSEAAEFAAAKDGIQPVTAMQILAWWLDKLVSENKYTIIVGIMELCVACMPHVNRRSQRNLHGFKKMLGM
jgi:hypothetical protein